MTGKGLSLLNALTLLRKLFWEVSSAIQEQYSQATTIPHFHKAGLHKQPLKYVVEKRCSHKCVCGFWNIPLNPVSKSFGYNFQGVYPLSWKLKGTNTYFLTNNLPDCFQFWDFYQNLWRLVWNFFCRDASSISLDITKLSTEFSLETCNYFEGNYIQGVSDI